MIYPIVAYGHPTLKRKAEDITQDYPNLREVIDQMMETMYETIGVGLAAPQVNLSIRLFVVDATPYKEEHPEAEDFKKVFINARIVEEQGEEWEFKEACLSIPNIAEYVSRKPRIRIQYYDEDFKYHDETYEGVLARIIQHEYDHIEGILFVEKINPLAKTLLRRKLNDIKTGKVDPSYKMIFAPKKKHKSHKK